MTKKTIICRFISAQLRTFMDTSCAETIADSLTPSVDKLIEEDSPSWKELTDALTEVLMDKLT